MAAQARSPVAQADANAALPLELEQAHPFEIWISNTLRIGVLISAALLSCGLLLLLVRGREAGDAASLHQLVHSPTTGVTLGPLLRHARELRASDVIRLGILALILTPVVRVAMTAVLFVAQRDWPFLGIVLVVFGVLLVGLTGVVG